VVLGFYISFRCGSGGSGGSCGSSGSCGSCGSFDYRGSSGSR